jgi:hypothetical protein
MGQELKILQAVGGEIQSVKKRNIVESGTFVWIRRVDSRGV